MQPKLVKAPGLLAVSPTTLAVPKGTARKNDFKLARVQSVNCNLSARKVPYVWHVRVQPS